jgi:ribonuclease VapC
MELLSLIRREEGEDEARAALLLVDSFPLDWVTCEPEILDAAATLKAAGGLSVADSWIAATALVRGAVLVHRDPEYAPLRQIRQERLA